MYYLRRLRSVVFVVACSLILAQGAALAQLDMGDDAGGAEGAAVEEAAGGGGGDGQETEGQGFIDIIYGGSPVNLLIWVLIFLTSAAVVAFIVDGLLTLQHDKLLPDDLIEGVRESLNEGDLDASMETCQENPGPLSTILMTGFSNIEEGYEVVQESVSSRAEIENERLMQRVSYLNLCGQISPMLGLLGTVLGMVRAFGGMAQASGAAKSQILAMSISTALWTTATGLLIAVPALVGYALLRNYARRLVMEMEATVLDLIKVLRNAEVEEEEE